MKRFIIHKSSSTRSLWLIALAFAVPHGIQGSWQSVMALTFGMIGEFKEKFTKAYIICQTIFHFQTSATTT